MTTPLDGVDLAVAVAQQVMGWETAGIVNGKCYIPCGRGYWAPHEEIADAWEVVEKLALPFELGWLPSDKDLNWDASFDELRGSESGTCTYADTAPLAICLAALKAVA